MKFTVADGNESRSILKSATVMVSRYSRPPAIGVASVTSTRTMPVVVAPCVLQRSQCKCTVSPGSSDRSLFLSVSSMLIEPPSGQAISGKKPIGTFSQRSTMPTPSFEYM